MSVMFEILERLERERGEVAANFTLEALSLIRHSPGIESGRRLPQPASPRVPSTKRQLLLSSKSPSCLLINWKKTIELGKASRQLNLAILGTAYRDGRWR